jgi:hypothetical protein
MSGSAPTNNQAVQFEEQQAAEAQQKEAQRQARLQQGQQLIDQIFSGSPVMGSRTQNFDWSTFQPPTTTGAAYGATSQPSGAPSGYTAIQVPTKGAGPRAAASPQVGWIAPAYSGGRYGSQGPATWGQMGAGGAGGAGGMTWALKDASGKIYYPGDPLSVTTQYDTGKRTGGFGPDFYNAYKQKILDYYNPQEAKQYAESQRDLTYNLARAGTLNSSTAADKTGELAYQDALAKASIVANANQQTGTLQNQIQANKEALINQLYATEDPTLTANLAESSAKASQLQDPTLTPAAAFFAPAATAVGSVAQSAFSPYALYGSSTTGAPIIQQPAVASAAGTGSGKVYRGQA